MEHEPTVLVVEDDDDTRDSIAILLSAEGYLVLTAATAHDALGTLQEPLSQIDVVVLDVHLPDGSGVGLCEHLREQYPRLPVIVCTGDADPGTEGRDLLRLGVKRYFRKPVAPAELLASIEAALA
jgi:DNA-binding response OmpR family regulator